MLNTWSITELYLPHSSFSLILGKKERRPTWVIYLWSILTNSPSEVFTDTSGLTAAAESASCFMAVWSHVNHLILIPAPYWGPAGFQLFYSGW